MKKNMLIGLAVSVLVLSPSVFSQTQLAVTQPEQGALKTIETGEAALRNKSNSAIQAIESLKAQNDLLIELSEQYESVSLLLDDSDPYQASLKNKLRILWEQKEADKTAARAALTEKKAKAEAEKKAKAEAERLRQARIVEEEARRRAAAFKLANENSGNPNQAGTNKSKPVMKPFKSSFIVFATAGMTSSSGESITPPRVLINTGEGLPSSLQVDSSFEYGGRRYTFVNVGKRDENTLEVIFNSDGRRVSFDYLINQTVGGQ